MNNARAADSFTCLQAHRVPAGGMTAIRDGDGSIGIFSNDTARRLGTLIPDGNDEGLLPVLPRPWLWFCGFLTGFGLAALVGILTCRYWLALVH